MPKKIDIVTGTYQLIRISGLTSRAIPEEVEIAMQVADDYAGELLATGLDTGWIQPLEYGQSDPDDVSGLTPQTVGPFKKLLAKQLVDYFGKAVTVSLQMNADKGMRALEQLLVNIRPTQNPSTLPIGSGNEWDYRYDKFYPEPISDDGAEYRFVTDVFQLNISWVQWLASAATIASVTYEFDVGVVITNESFTDDTSVATISFDRVGQFTVCATATDTNGNVKSEKFIYNATKCLDNYYP